MMTLPEVLRVLDLPAHYAIEAVCAACRGAIRSSDGRYMVNAAVYHADCFDISLFGARREEIDER